MEVLVAFMANRIREKVESEVFRFNDLNISITISGGVSSFVDNKASSSSELIRFADESLYAAKANGRNRVEVYKNH